MSFDAYKVAVKLTLVNHVSTGLAAIASQLRPLHQQFVGVQAGAAGLHRELLEIKRLGLIGGALAGVGFAGLSLMKGPLEEAKKFDQQVAKFRLFGLGEAVTGEAATYAKAMKIMGSTAVENMRLMNEAQGVFRESGLAGPKALEGAKLAAPMLAKINFATESLDEDSKSRMRTQAMSMLRFVEMRGGLKDAATFNAIADSGWKAIQSSGGNINWEHLRQFMARGGVAAQGLTDTSLYGKLEPIIGELKGSTAGDAWMTAYNRLTGGVRIPNQVAHLLAENGIWDKSRIEWNTMGGIKRFKGNPLKDMATYATEPSDFYEKNILPMYAKMNNGKGLTQVERGRENLMIFGRTGGKFFSLIDRQLETIHKSVAAQAKALGVDSSVRVASGTLAGKEIDLHAKWLDTQRQLGEVVLPIAIKAVEGMTSALKSFTTFARENPGTIKVLTLSFVGLSAAMAFGGTVMLLTAAMRGLSLATTVLAGAQGASGLAGIAAKVSNFGGVIGLLANPIGIAVLALGTLIAAAYAFRPLTQKEVDAAKTDGGVHLTPDALARSKAMGWKPPEVSSTGFGPKASFLSKDKQDKADAAFYAGWKNQKPFWQDVAGMFGFKGQQKPTITRASQEAAPSAKPAVGVAPQASNTVQVNTQVNLDGKRIADVVTTHQARDMSRPPVGASSFDGSMNLRALGTGFAGG